MQATPPKSDITRARISQDLAFPVGYELLQQSLGDVPQWSKLSINFSAFPTRFASEFTRILRSQKPYSVVHLRHFFHDLRACGLHSGSWCLYIYPVHRALKSHARAALLSGPLSVLRDFLVAAPITPTYPISREILFDPVEHTGTVHAPKK